MIPPIERLLYRVLLEGLRPVLLGHLAWVARRQGEPRYWQERRGYYPRALEVRPIWIHAASVGELNAALPLIDSLRRRYPDIPLLVTSNTVSSGRLAASRLPSGVYHAYLPIDWPHAVARFFDHYQPRCALIIETELWLNLYHACRTRGLPLIIINGRLSPRTLKAPAWLLRLYGFALAQATAILARSAADREGFIALGAAPQQVQVVGNIKFAAARPTAVAPIDLGRPYVLAASTREGEEALVAAAWEQAGADHLLVIAPRHPQRLPQIQKALTPLNLPVAVRSRSEPISAATAIYLADTFGELTRFMAGAELVFVGGSLVPAGGQNILEPAAQGKAVVFGPHMENFADEARLLCAEGAALQVNSPEELAKAFGHLLSDEQRRQELGERGRSVVAARIDMAERYAECLETLCPALKH